MFPFISIILGIYILDLVTKILIRSHLPLGAEISLLPFFSITHIENTGVAFGMFQGWNGVLLGLGLIIVSVVVVLGVKSLKTDRSFALILALVVGGALGNLTDRVFQGKVTDFLDFFIGNWHWPAFNVADSAICIGATLLIIYSFKRKG